MDRLLIIVMSSIQGKFQSSHSFSAMDRVKCFMHITPMPKSFNRATAFQLWIDQILGELENLVFQFQSSHSFSAMDRTIVVYFLFKNLIVSIEPQLFSYG